MTFLTDEKIERKQSNPAKARTKNPTPDRIVEITEIFVRLGLLKASSKVRVKMNLQKINPIETFRKIFLFFFKKTNSSSVENKLRTCVIIRNRSIVKNITGSESKNNGFIFF